MFKKLGVIVFAFMCMMVGLFGAGATQTTSAQDTVPTATQVPPRGITATVWNSALAELSRNQQRNITNRNILRYDFEEVFDNFTPVCEGVAASTEARFIRFTFITDEFREVIVHVLPDGSRSRSCGDREVTPTPTVTNTPTPTIDYTLTTATFTWTPSPTLTPSLTFTPSNTWTPTSTITPSPTLTPSLTWTPSNTFTPTLTPTPTNTPTFTLTPRPNAVTCPGFMTSRLNPGESATVIGTDPLRLRQTPSTSGGQLAIVNVGAQVVILNGPECDPNGFAWWNVTYRSNSGWIAEGFGEEYWLEPIIPPTTNPTAAALLTLTAPVSTVPPRTTQPDAAATSSTVITCPGFLPSRLVIGGMGYVTPGDPNNVRDVPSASGALLEQIPSEGVFTVLEGPICDANGRAWWRVDYNGLVGWTVEGQGSDYYVEPILG